MLNAIVAGVCVLGLAGSLLLFQNDFNRSRLKLAEQPVGTVSWKTGGIKRLFAGRKLWDRLSVHAQVYNGDTISAPASTGVWINFTNGEVLELDENTAVRILYLDGDISEIELIRGNISVLSDRFSVEIIPGGDSGLQAAGIRVRVNPKTRASLRITENSRLDINVFQGTASIGAAAETRRLAAGESLAAGSDGTFLDIPLVSMISPRDGIRILADSQEKRPLDFIWRGVNLPENSGILLKIAGDRRFNNIIETVRGDGSGKAPVNLGPGTYYWRLYPEAAPSEIAGSGRLDIVFSPGLQALSPADGEIFYFGTKRPPVHFAWTFPEEAASILVEIADNPGMNNPLLSRKLEKMPQHYGYFNFAGLEEGTWYWHLRPRYHDGVESTVQNPAVRSFIISRAGELPAPLPVAPAEFSAVYTGHGRENIYFTWKTEPEAVSYMILISNRPDMWNPVVNQTVSRNYYRHNTEELPLEPGTWYWSVSQTGEQNRRSQPGRAVLFYLRNAETAPRTIFPPDNFSIPANRSQDINYSWKSTLPHQARIQIAGRPDFAGPLVVNEIVYGGSMQGRYLQPGTYYWRISAGGGSSRMDSPPSRLVIIPALRAPEMESPSGGETIRITEGTPVLFSWQRVDYADYYQFRLYTDSRTDPLCEITSLRDNRLQVHFDPRTNGRFRWTVQAFSAADDDNSGRAGLIGTAVFNAGTQAVGAGAAENWAIPRIANVQSYSGQIRSPITLLSPPPGVEISGISALRSPPVARWRSDELLRNAQLLVSRSFDPMSDPRAIVLDAGRRNSLTFPVLGEGIWYWVIRADTSSERGVSSGDPSWFTVLPLPLFPAPRQPSPGNGMVISLAQLTADRNITFSWRNVPGANAYIFSLFGVADPPQLLLTASPDESLSFILQDLTLLMGHDSYLWQAEAVYRNAAGTIEQRGVIEQHTFSLEVSHSNSLQTRTHEGPMYGQ
ncbi:MAG: FecR family protein [Treponema sp.]|nr:FecR family protein [Treponema sp.]